MSTTRDLNPANDDPMADDFCDLLAAAASALAFWDNALDDEDWNLKS